MSLTPTNSLCTWIFEGEKHRAGSVRGRFVIQIQRFLGRTGWDGAGNNLCQAEIKNLAVAATLGDEDVGGLDVPMDDSFGVCRVESIGNLNAQIKHGFRSLAAFQQSGDGASVPPAIPWR